jgi:hypothetical protein
MAQAPRQPRRASRSTCSPSLSSVMLSVSNCSPPHFSCASGAGCCRALPHLPAGDGPVERHGRRGADGHHSCGVEIHAGLGMSTIALMSTCHEPQSHATHRNKCDPPSTPQASLLLFCLRRHGAAALPSRRHARGVFHSRRTRGYGHPRHSWPRQPRGGRGDACGEGTSRDGCSGKRARGARGVGALGNALTGCLGGGLGAALAPARLCLATALIDHWLSPTAACKVLRPSPPGRARPGAATPA